MSRGKYTPEFKAKIVLEVLQGERELGAIYRETALLHERITLTQMHGGNYEKYKPNDRLLRTGL